MAGFRIRIKEYPSEVDVTVEVDPGKSPVDLARVLAGAFVHVTRPIGEVFNMLARGLSPTQTGLHDKDRSVTLENAKEVKGGPHLRRHPKHR